MRCNTETFLINLHVLSAYNMAIARPASEYIQLRVILVPWDVKIEVIDPYE